MNHDTLLRFTKDQKIPISIFDEPYFSYFLNLYDEDFHTKQAYELLIQTISKFENEDAFLDKYYEIRNNIIERIKDLPEYAAFLSSDMKAYKIEDPKLPDTNKGDVYKLSNVGCYYISIDLQKANFQMLKKFSPTLVLGAETYEDFLENFTDMEYFKKSKYIRQVIFGNMNPGRQTTMQKFYTKQILELLLNNYGVSPEQIAVFAFDEIVIRETNFVPKEKLLKLKEIIKKQLALDVSVTSFRLNNIGDKDFFVKEESNGQFSMKKVPNIYFAQAYKKYKGLAIEDNDLLFFYEKNLAKFLTPIF